MEGMRPQVLEEVLRRAGATFLEGNGEEAPTGRPVTKADLMRDGLTGGAGSAERRRALQRTLDLPEHLTANALVEVLNRLYGYEAYRRAVEALEELSE